MLDSLTGIVGLPPTKHQQDISILILIGIVVELLEDALAPLTDILDILKVGFIVLGAAVEETAFSGEQIVRLFLGLVLENLTAERKQCFHIFQCTFAERAILAIAEVGQQEIDFAEVTYLLHSVCLTKLRHSIVMRLDFLFSSQFVLCGERIKLTVAHTTGLRLGFFPVFEVLIVAVEVGSLDSIEIDV